MTLDKVVVELDGFTHGMEYVALSRVKTLNGLGISHLNMQRFLNNNIACKEALTILDNLNEFKN